MNAKVAQYLQTGGALDTRQTTLNKQLKQLSDKRDTVQLRLDNLQKGMMKQFIAMDISVGRFQSTSSFLSNQINQWG
jgi:flagellar hook-associated protein 2